APRPPRTSPRRAPAPAARQLPAMAASGVVRLGLRRPPADLYRSPASPDPAVRLSLDAPGGSQLLARDCRAGKPSAGETWAGDGRVRMHEGPGCSSARIRVTT